MDDLLYSKIYTVSNAIALSEWQNAKTSMIFQEGK